MHQRSVLRVGASLLVTALALTACGSRGDDDKGSSNSETKKVAKIGVISPQSGELSALGLGIQHSVELAVKQANDANAIPGWTLEVEPLDDESKPDVGRNAATKAVADKDLVAVVGTLNSDVAQTVQPVLAPANITQVSPANTNPALTQGTDWKSNPKRAYPTYFRTCTTDAIQGPFAARYLVEKANIKKVATVHDKRTYGQGLVETFTEEFKSLGGTVVAAQTINPDESDYNAVVSAIKPKNPEAVYYGGQYPQAGPLSKQAKALGLKVPVMGGDGIFSGDYLKLAGASGNGDLATSVGAPTEKLDSAKKFVADYNAGGYKEPYEAYGAYSFDAANAIIAALKVSLKDAADATSARKPTVDAMANVSFEGVTGKVGFDQYGDTTTRVLTTYKVTAGKWADVDTATFEEK